MIRTKLVVISRMAGARLSTVSSSMTCSVELSRSGLVHDSRPAAKGLGDRIGQKRSGDGERSSSMGRRLPAVPERTLASASARRMQPHQRNE